MNDEVDVIEAARQPAEAIAWHGDLDPELGQLVQQKGWRSASDALNSYRHLERLVGADRLALPAADAGDEAWAPVWDKLGRPKEAAAYPLAAPEGKPYDPATADWFRDLAHRIGLTSTQAQALHDGFLARLPVSETPAREQPRGPDPAESLRELWGHRHEANMAAARRAYAAFLAEEAPFHDIADAIGETALMQMLAKVGRMIGEDSITARADGNSGPRNPAEALAEIAKLQRAAQADSQHPYVSKTHPEHQNLVKRMEALYALAYEE
ncbi:hypothetical protein [Dongia sp.]|uniref:hypothetical protein n=1 Tax=Dongia sp. TaxID=1977262 RepID=UPI0035AEF803